MWPFASISGNAKDAFVRETAAVVTGAAEQPHTATSIVLILGALAFAICCVAIDAA